MHDINPIYSGVKVKGPRKRITKHAFLDDSLASSVRDGCCNAIAVISLFNIFCFNARFRVS